MSKRIAWPGQMTAGIVWDAYIAHRRLVAAGDVQDTKYTFYECLVAVHNIAAPSHTITMKDIDFTIDRKNESGDKVTRTFTSKISGLFAAAKAKTCTGPGAKTKYAGVHLPRKGGNQDWGKRKSALDELMTNNASVFTAAKKKKATTKKK